ncbi:MAG: GntR family transcriptional regulator [Bacteroidetes bacterium]|nr:GntR family transcriptional regulator [Bacteroidota bacterium]MBT7463926.1 GntR family transcriptional regulator [Bacteroidota bacterium]
MPDNENGMRLHIDQESGVPKFQQLIDTVIDAVSRGDLIPGNILPSVNQIFQNTGLARGTIVKALDELKRRGIIESVPNKGYFIASNKRRVLLLLDTLRPFKQVIYDGLRKGLPDNVEVNMFFHHYNIRLMEEILLGASGKYSAYIVMGYNHPEIPRILEKLDPNKVIVFDWMDQDWGDYSHVVQEFEKSFYDSMVEAMPLLKKYESLVFVCPESANHPPEAQSAFSRFCEDHKMKGLIRDHLAKDIKGKAFLVVDDKHLIELVTMARKSKLKAGKDLGIISFNDYPMKEVLEGGISVISPSFDEMTSQIAQSLNNRKKLRSLVLPKLILRNSL